MTHGVTRRLVLLLAATLATGILVAGCGTSPPDDAHTLSLLAGSELKDLEPLLPEIQDKTGVAVKLNYVGTLEGAERIANGDKADGAWFSHGKYLSLLPGTASKIVAQQRIMLSPVVLGVKRSVAQRLGWDGSKPVTWKDIADRSADGSFHFAMTNPAASNSGMTALIGVASALAGSSDALDAGTIDVEGLKRFFVGQSLTAGSSGFLADDYVARAGPPRRPRELRVDPPQPQRGRDAARTADAHLPLGRHRHRRLPADVAQRLEARGVAEARRTTCARPTSSAGS